MCMVLILLDQPRTGPYETNLRPVSHWLQLLGIRGNCRGFAAGRGCAAGTYGAADAVLEVPVVLRQPSAYAGTTKRNHLVSSN